MSQAEQQWRASAEDPTELNVLTRRLLVSALYTLVPVGAAPPAWQLWRHPSGAVAVPCFLSEGSARVAAKGQTQIVKAAGRDIFESLHSTAVWVDPEDGKSLLLQPAQLIELLASMPAPAQVGTDATLEAWSEANDLPPEVGTAWCTLLTQFEHVTAAYWLGRDSRGSLVNRKLVIVTCREQGDDTARALDALCAALRANYAGAMRIEAQALCQEELPEAHRRLESIAPFYWLRRSH